MTGTDDGFVDTARPEPKRDQYGRYRVPNPKGKEVSYQRVTTFAGMLADTYNLSRWQIRSALAGVAARHDLYAQYATLTDPVDADKKAANRIADQAIEAAAASRGANLGTALHSFTEQLDLGHDATVPPPWDADVAAYRDTLERAGVTVDRTLVERIVLLDELEVAGMFDRIVTLDGVRYIADLKTGKDPAAFPHEICVQLACYAHADVMYDPGTGQRVPMPDVDRSKALVIHLPPGQATCTLWWFDIAAGWEMVEHCAAVRAWRKRKQLTFPFTEPEPAAAPAPRSKPQRIDPLPQTKAAAPDEGPTVNIEQATIKLTAGFAAYGIDGPLMTTWNRWVKEGRFRFSDLPSTRRFELYRAGARLVALTQGDDQEARDLLGVIHKQPVETSKKVGEVLGGFTVDQAKELTAVCDAITGGATVTYLDDGTPVVAA